MVRQQAIFSNEIRVSETVSFKSVSRQRYAENNVD